MKYSYMCASMCGILGTAGLQANTGSLEADVQPCDRPAAIIAVRGLTVQNRDRTWRDVQLLPFWVDIIITLHSTAWSACVNTVLALVLIVGHHARLALA